MSELEQITHSELSTHRRCPRMYYFRYHMQLSPVRDQVPLRMGKAHHRGLELHGNGLADQDAIDQATASYVGPPPAGMDEHAWLIEGETVRQLLAGWLWRYSADMVVVRRIAVEAAFTVPLVNPETQAVSRSFVLAGKLDAIVELSDGRMAVYEAKTAGEDIGPDAAYWLRLRKDPQISLYYLAARALGHEVATVIYDVTRKPTIRPNQVPLLDERGDKIVLDRDGNRVMTKQGKPRQTSSSEDGYTLQCRLELPDEFAERLLNDIGNRPDYYYQRREVPRLADELAQFQAELWQQAQLLLECRRRAARLPRPQDAYFCNVGRFTCDNCPFAEICLQSITVNPDQPPSGYVVRSDKHPELIPDEGDQS